MAKGKGKAKGNTFYGKASGVRHQLDNSAKKKYNVKHYYCGICSAEFLPIRSDIRHQIFCNECHEIITNLVQAKKDLKFVE